MSSIALTLLAWLAAAAQEPPDDGKYRALVGRLADDAPLARHDAASALHAARHDAGPPPGRATGVLGGRREPPAPGARARRAAAGTAVARARLIDLFYQAGIDVSIGDDAVRALIADPATRPAVIGWVSSRPRFGPELEGLLDRANPEETVRLLAALRRMGRPLPAPRLQRLLAHDDADVRAEAMQPIPEEA